ncbi:fungal-specific transcription factor-like protein [Lineolata rhizophorae]|uniref:Fungal-specific transcription factor-like protein n=1 Tax=Lineolata rhizophorae TaxID=578093 RepID=A0A6A6PAR7_9PEZI|nr:fungal-specific transcription factor-like protein [Lineolata rhizophorae]
MNSVDSGDPSSDHGHSEGKRKSADGGQPQPRAKRNRYISIACNECKRRKIKCNGQTPCQRCGAMKLECVYAPNCCNNFQDSEEFKRMDAQINSLQEQVNTLFSNLNALRNCLDASIASTVEGSPYSQSQPPRAVASLSQRSPHSAPDASPARDTINQPKAHRFRGPTSAAFNLGVAKSSLQTMGIPVTGAEDGVEEAIGSREGSLVASPPPAMPAKQTFENNRQIHWNKDPIWQVGKEEALRLCRLYQDEITTMYPVFDMDRLIAHATLLYRFMEAADRAGLVQSGLPGADSLLDDFTCVLKLVLAVALVLEGDGKSELGERLFQAVRPIVEAQSLNEVSVKGIRLLVISAIYYFMRDDEGLAWRIIGLAARSCMELGLHRREAYHTLFKDDDERAEGTRLFWAVYVLDRRWSFGTGLPFALQDADIDAQLAKPDDTYPYLSAMVAYGNLGSKVWKSIGNVDSSSSSHCINKEEIGYLDYQVMQWHSSIPDQLKYSHPNSEKNGGTPQASRNPSKSLKRQRVSLYLRANLMRIHIYRPVLHTATSIMENMDHAQTVVEVAKDTIRVLTHTNRTTDLYQTQQVLFHYFLVSALAVLFLAVSHAPAQFSENCRDEFYMALDLVRNLSANSWVSKRLWKTIGVLKEVGPRLGLNVRPTAAGAGAAAAATSVDPSDPHSSAAVAMAGLAGHPIDEMSVFAGGRGGRASEAPSGHSPNGMANEFASLFEAVGGYGGNMPLPNGYGSMPAGGVDAANGGVWMEDQLSNILRDLF